MYSIQSAQEPEQIVNTSRHHINHNPARLINHQSSSSALVALGKYTEVGHALHERNHQGVASKAQASNGGGDYDGIVDCKRTAPAQAPVRACEWRGRSSPMWLSSLNVNRGVAMKGIHAVF
jgi:hypothetical protein